MTDLSGKKYGRLTAVRETKQRYFKQIVWNCICDCGKTVDVPRNSLVSGRKKSCGCLFLNDLTGNVYGRLTVFSRDYTKKTNTYWNCICDCGKIVSVYGGNLKRKLTKSCGCLNVEETTRRDFARHMKTTPECVPDGLILAQVEFTRLNKEILRIKNAEY